MIVKHFFICSVAPNVKSKLESLRLEHKNLREDFTAGFVDMKAVIAIQAAEVTRLKSMLVLPG